MHLFAVKNCNGQTLRKKGMLKELISLIYEQYAEQVARDDSYVKNTLNIPHF